METPPPPDPNEPEFKLSLTIKWCLFLAAWGFVLVKCLIWNPESIIDTPFFPIGLIAWLPNGEDKAIMVWFFQGWIIGWLFYACLSFLMFKTKNSELFFLIYILFFSLLVLNIVGCKRVMEAVSEIH